MIPNPVKFCDCLLCPTVGDFKTCPDISFVIFREKPPPDWFFDIISRTRLELVVILVIFLIEILV
jgi:hypothetical protein